MRNITLPLIALCALLWTPLGLQADANVYAVHGVPGAVVDVCVNGNVAIPGFTFTTIAGPLTVPAGMYEVKAVGASAGCDSSALIPPLTANLSDGDNVSIVAHLSADGQSLTLTPFFNDLTAIPSQGLPPAAAPSSRLAVRHTAAAPTVSVVANGRRVFTLSNAAESQADVPTHGYAVWLALPDGRSLKPVFGPLNLNLQPAKNHIAYAVGSISNGTFTVLLQVLDLY